MRPESTPTRRSATPLGGAIAASRGGPHGPRFAVHASNLTPRELLQLGALLGAEGRANLARFRRWPR